MNNFIYYNIIKLINRHDAAAASSRPQRCLCGASRQPSPGKAEICSRNKFHPNPTRATTSQTPRREPRLFSLSNKIVPTCRGINSGEMTQTKRINGEINKKKRERFTVWGCWEGGKEAKPCVRVNSNPAWLAGRKERF